MTDVRKLNAIRDAGVDQALDDFGPVDVTLALAEICSKNTHAADRTPQGVSRADWKRAAKLLDGLSRRFPQEMIAESRGAVGHARALVSRTVERYGLLDVVEACADSSEEEAFELDADARDEADSPLHDEADDWGRCAKLFQWAADKLGQIGF